MKIEKNALKKNFAKLTQKKGISLIVLIVTIIVMIILAAVVILTVSKNNPVESAREAKFKEDIRAFQDELALSVSKDYTVQSGQRDNKFSATEFENIKNYIPSFTKEYDGKIIIKNDELIYDETVTGKEKNWLEELKIRKRTSAEKVEEKPQDYYGKSITNYDVNGVTDWKIFYSDGSNVYLIAPDYIDVDKLPTTSAGNKPENTHSSYTKAAPFTNILKDYKGSIDITDERIKALNSDYFSKGYTSTKPNMKAVAYMLDTEIWSSFAGEKAEYAIGGPTVEMLMKSYNQKYDKEYKARASGVAGYEISRDGGTNWAIWYNGMLKKEDMLYVLPSSNGAEAMWLASPSYLATGHDCVMYVTYYGAIWTYVNSNAHGFRPIVCLKSDVMLKEVNENYELVL